MQHAMYFTYHLLQPADMLLPICKLGILDVLKCLPCNAILNLIQAIMPSTIYIARIRKHWDLLEALSQDSVSNMLAQ